MNMKMVKDAALIALGAGAIMAYQKYQAPIKKNIEKTMNQALRKADQTLENMM